jgi:hypothetical protein
VRLFNLDLQKRWGTFSIYEKFEHLIITLLTAIIAAIVGAATWQLILHTFALVRSHLGYRGAMEQKTRLRIGFDCA